MTKKSSEPEAFKVVMKPGESDDRAKARYAVEPIVQAAGTIRHFLSEPFYDLSINELIGELSELNDQSVSGNLSGSETLLTSQAKTLDAIFNKLARLASFNIATNLSAADTLLRLGLRAQSQCRSTIEALAEIKNPGHVTFAKQVNNSAGPQQVNNGALASGISRPVRAGAEESKIPPNKLLEQTHGERLELGAKGAAGGTDTPLETVGAVNGSEDDGR
jgi:hypothetical protein